MLYTYFFLVSSADIKKIYTWLGNLHIEKSKLEKGEKSKKSKGKGKAKLKMEGDNVSNICLIQFTFNLLVTYWEI